MHIDFTIFFKSTFHKVNSFVKYSFNVFSWMVFKVKSQILKVFIVIIRTIVSSTINNMCYSIFKQNAFIFC